jgi:crossover junction endodeoxyribonuclease RuvC
LIAVPAPAAGPRPAKVCLGIDPGLVRCGWGVVRLDGTRLSHVAHGVIKPPTDRDLADRLLILSDAVAAIAAEHTPTVAAIEETFVNDNPRSALHLGHARAAAMIACARAGLSMREYAPATVKKTVVGSGRADKDQVAFMIQRLMPAAGQVKADAADALAVAICALHGA